VNDMSARYREFFTAAHAFLHPIESGHQCAAKSIVARVAITSPTQKRSRQELPGSFSSAQ
jgi:hypothetical protein